MPKAWETADLGGKRRVAKELDKLNLPPCDPSDLNACDFQENSAFETTKTAATLPATPVHGDKLYSFIDINSWWTDQKQADAVNHGTDVYGASNPWEYIYGGIDYPMLIVPEAYDTTTNTALVT